MTTLPDLTQVETYNREIDPTFDFRDIAKQTLKEISPNELAIFNRKGLYQHQSEFS